MKGVALVAAAAAAMIALTASPAEGITCQQVEKSLGPCASYLTKGGYPGSPCCNGMRDLKNNTPYTADRRATCSVFLENPSFGADDYLDIRVALFPSTGNRFDGPRSQASDSN
ncbi:hypothetical protein NL676_001274 [Syzygium grande]|nr:hypothetical protein NL676_001274 [Syzygium grande]